MGERKKNALNKIEYLIPPVIVFLIFAIVGVVNNIYPFGDKTISWCDMRQQVVPLLCDFKDVLSGQSGCFLSTVNAGGMSFYGLFLFYLSSPFSFLVAFVDKAEMSVFCNVLVMLKMMTASLTAYIYLKTIVKKLCDILAISLSILYAFSGYIMMYYQILSWLDCVYIFPIILLGLERMKEGKSIAVYTLSLAFSVVCSFYISYMIVVYIILYVGTTAIITKDKKFCFKFIAGSFIACLISAIVYIPVLYQYFNSARTGSVIDNLMSSASFTYYFTVFPTFFCLFSIVPLLVSHKWNNKTMVLGIMLVFTILPAIFEPINKMWHTGSYMSFPSRYGFLTIFTSIVLVANNFSQVQEILKVRKITKIIIFLICFIACFAVCVYTKIYCGENIEVLSRFSQTLWGNESSYKGLLQIYIVVLVVAIILKVLLHFRLISKLGLGICILLLVVNEAFFSSSVYLVAPSHDDTSFKNQIALSNIIDDDSFYRVKTSSKLFDVNIVGANGYNTLSHYTSLTDCDYMKMIKQLGYSSYWMEIGCYGGTAFSDAVFGNKYEIVSGNRSGAIASTNKYSIIKKDYVLPLGIFTCEDIPIELNGERVDCVKQLYKGMTGRDDLIKKYEYKSLIGVIDESKDGTYRYSLDGTNGYILYQISIEEESNLYFDCFDLYTTALKQHINGSFKIVVNGSTKHSEFPAQNSNGLLYLGTFNDTTVEIKVYLNKNFYGSSFGVFSESINAIDNVVSQHECANLTICKNKIIGQITAPSDGNVVLSMPYSDNYKCKVNGKIANSQKVFTDMLSISVEKGLNKIEISYLPSGLILGLIISCLGIILFVLYLAFFKKIVYNTKYLNVENVFSKTAFVLTITLFGIVAFIIYIFPEAMFFLGSL